jgi:hypothetical protein
MITLIIAYSAVGMAYMLGRLQAAPKTKQKKEES